MTNDGSSPFAARLPTLRRRLRSSPHREGGHDAQEPVSGLALRRWGPRLRLTVAGCAKKEAPALPRPPRRQPPTPADGGKIPVTTSSAEAKAEFLQGRDMVEKLLVTDSIAHFQKAVSLDPNFALAELRLADSAPTGKEFFEHLHKAVAWPTRPPTARSS